MVPKLSSKSDALYPFSSKVFWNITECWTFISLLCHIGCHIVSSEGHVVSAQALKTHFQNAFLCRNNLHLERFFDDKLSLNIAVPTGGRCLAVRFSTSFGPCNVKLLRPKTNLCDGDGTGRHAMCATTNSIFLTF